MKTKRFFTGLLTFFLIVVLLCPGVSAETTSGSCDDNATWHFDSSSGTLTISGTGSFKGVSGESTTGFGQYRSQTIHIRIEEGITAIESFSFPHFRQLKSLYIADSVKTIGEWAFFECESLTDLVLGTGITSIENTAFNSAFSLQNVILPQSLQTLGGESFAHTNISNISLPEGVAVIDCGTFRACDNLKQIYIPASVTAINYAAFRGCESLSDVYYGGTQAQWEAININTSNEDPYRGNNEHLLAATVHYNHSHSWDNGSVTQAANCQQTGLKTYRCACSAAKTETVSKTGHSWDNGKITTAATCIKNGVKTYTCSVCKTAKEETVAATDHSWNSGKTNADTTVTYACINCNTTKTEGTPTETTVPSTDETTVPAENTISSSENTISPSESIPSQETSPVDDEIKPDNRFPWAAVIIITVSLLSGGGVGAWFWLKKKKTQ